VWWVLGLAGALELCVQSLHWGSHAIRRRGCSPATRALIKITGASAAFIAGYSAVVLVGLGVAAIRQDPSPFYAAAPLVGLIVAIGVLARAAHGARHPHPRKLEAAQLPYRTPREAESAPRAAPVRSPLMRVRLVVALLALLQAGCGPPPVVWFACRHVAPACSSYALADTIAHRPGFWNRRADVSWGSYHGDPTTYSRFTPAEYEVLQDRGASAVPAVVSVLKGLSEDYPLLPRSASTPDSYYNEMNHANTERLTSLLGLLREDLRQPSLAELRRWVMNERAPADARVLAARMLASQNRSEDLHVLITAACDLSGDYMGEALETELKRFRQSQVLDHLEAIVLTSETRPCVRAMALELILDVNTPESWAALVRIVRSPGEDVASAVLRAMRLWSSPDRDGELSARAARRGDPLRDACAVVRDVERKLPPRYHDHVRFCETPSSSPGAW
jgi:hypothetical protein